MPATLIANTRIFDGVSVVTESGHVLINAGCISQISLREPLSAPEGCSVVDATGCTLLPGLIDAHTHVYQDVGLLETSMQYGVTTVFDMHNEPEWFKNISAVTRQRKDIADVKSCGFGATIKNGWPAAIVKLVSREPNVEERISKWPDLVDKQSIDNFIARNRAAGASFTKLMQEDGHTMTLPFPTKPVPTPSLEIQRAIVDASHDKGMLTVAHALTNHSTLSVLEAGVDGLAHASIDPITEDVIKAFKKNNAFLIPTLAVHASCSGEEQESRERFASSLQGPEKEHLLGCLCITRKDLSIKTVGTDTSTELLGTRAGASVHHELWMYVNRCRFTPQEALCSATSKVADRFKLSDRGKIETGRLADLLLVSGNPVESIDAIGDIQGVWRNGERLARK
ncbi:hypothetical protein N7532_006413 [Penicillium argentinense]|uniref:Amidohydrolase-related domain-containing protein n=1 Tax=Penicillium argentinense TaxID=1131581 RepID=A0A9W9FG89_9EURO|nr:uncharacterized protein N7532_006413 [Penicillium argentinense]KAJ5099412.1 hypothetical protein N7532_006413 [Penicillium argentinense]